MLHEGSDRPAQWASQGWLATADTGIWIRYEEDTQELFTGLAERWILSPQEIQINKVIDVLFVRRLETPSEKTHLQICDFEVQISSSSRRCSPCTEIQTDSLCFLSSRSPFILIQTRTDLFPYFRFGVMLADLSGPPSTLEEPPSLRLSTTRNRGSSSMTIPTVSFESPKPHADVEKTSYRNKSEKRTSHRFSHGSRCWTFMPRWIRLPQ